MLMVSISQFSKKNSKTVLNENKGLKWNKSEGYVENIVHNHWNFWLVSLCNIEWTEMKEEDENINTIYHLTVEKKLVDGGFNDEEY